MGIPYCTRFKVLGLVRWRKATNRCMRAHIVGLFVPGTWNGKGLDGRFLSLQSPCGLGQDTRGSATLWVMRSSASALRSKDESNLGVDRVSPRGASRRGSGTRLAFIYQIVLHWIFGMRLEPIERKGVWGIPDLPTVFAAPATSKAAAARGTLIYIHRINL